MMFKKVYIEITNVCNLNCPFCIHNKRSNRYMSRLEFLDVLDKLKGHTKYLYFHVLGEPLMHPLINEFIDIASKDFYVNITTNGYLINKIKNNKNIRQINISLHSSNNYDEYLDNIFEVTDKLRKYTYINYRLWTGVNNEVLNKLNKKYNTNLSGSGKFSSNVFLDIGREFTWPSLDNTLYSDKGSCYGLIHHFGILVDGTIVPCCLDANGCIKLGNIFYDDLDEVLNSDRVNKIRDGFKSNKLCEELCKHCGFKDGGNNDL